MIRLLADCITAAFREDIRETCARQDATRLYAWQRFGVLLMLAMVLAGCERMTQTITRPVPPLAVVCAAECKTACAVTADAKWRPSDPSSGKAWKELIEQSVATLVKSVETCDAHRSACADCIQTIERSGRVCGTFEVCQ